MNRQISKSVKLQPKYRALSLGRTKIVPELRISGVWLESQGFHPGDMVDIQVHNGMLVIKALG
ncbi:SymE family type I addiction module toxin [Pedobacter sp. FW305-3-2-15-E-R2A2]|uniref:SymE family type I addiction module toxin n=1 Tax=Pedobacter sp. FW305-3-2-15-E-R2A2 TaxID=3140251 RepID=UPI0031402AFB